jgi:hypothetical protein
MGPELTLAILGVALAGPGVATAFRDVGTLIVKRVDTIKNAPGFILELQQVGRAVCEGKLQACIDIAEHAFDRESLNQALRADLTRGLEQMREELVNIDTLLQKLIEDNGKVSKVKTMLPPRWTWKTDAKRIIRKFDKAQSGFQLTVSIVDSQHRAVSIPPPLSRSRYKPRVNSDGTFYSILEPKSHLWQGQAEIRDPVGLPISVRVIIERSEAPSSEIPIIASHLVKSKGARGVLKCLGYHEEQDPCLVFQVPGDLGNPSTLRSTMLKTPRSMQAPGGGHALEDRMRLAYLISESVLFVHNAEFVHKNIRPDTFLLLRPHSTTLQPLQSLVGTRPHLRHWTMLRKASDLTSLRGEMSWLKDIYRHPHRQGLQPQERYNIGHDIYSLGVCLLEIGLWEPLTITKSDTDALFVDLNDTYDVTEQTMSETYRQMAIDHRFVTPEESDSIDALTKPSTVMEILIALAEKSLPQRVGTEYSNIVIACLSCLNGGFGEDLSALDFSQHATSVVLRFKLLVIEPLSRMY